MPGIGGFHDGISGKGRRHKNYAGFGADVAAPTP